MTSVVANISNLSSTIPLTSLNATPLDLRTHVGVRSPSPSTSPGLQIIQEEGNRCNRNSTRPQISLTDEMGGEVTLIPCLSVSSCESTDSIEIENYKIEDDAMMVDSNQFNPGALPSFVISGPCDFSKPSIVRGIGKKNEKTNKDFTSPNENIVHKIRVPDKNTVNTVLTSSADELLIPMNSQEHAEDFSEMCINDIENRIEEKTDSSNFYSGCSISTGDLFASELLEKTSSGSFEVRLSKYYSDLDTNDILTIVKKIIDVKAPPKCCFISSKENLSVTEEKGLSLEYPEGVQIEVKVCEKSGCEEKGLKLRRISGDQLKYSQLCQQLISCMIV